MKTFLLIAGMVVTFVLGGMIVYFGDAWYFEEHTGGTTLAAIYDAEQQCEADTDQHCQLNSYFLPDSFFGKSKATDRNWL